MDNGAFGELYQVKINGLWGKTDIVFDLYKDCNILIGENGIGKTTALKILESVLDLNFIRMAKYNFDSIEFVFDTEEEIKFEYADFIVPAQMIEDAFYRVYKKRNQEQKLLRLKFKKMLEYLFKARLIGRVLNSIYTEAYTSEVIDAVSKYMSVDVIKPLKNELEILNPLNDEFGDSTNIISYAQTHFVKSKAAQKVAEGIYTEPVFSDMVNKVKFYYGDESFVKYHYTDKATNPNKAYKYTFWKCDSESEIEELLSQCEKSELCECLEDKNLCYNGRYIERLFEDDAEHNAFAILKAVKDKTGYFDINSIIKSDWHSFDEICDLNDTALEGAKKYFELIKNQKEYSKDEVSKLLNTFDDRLLGIHHHYCKPVLAEESPFKADLYKIINDVSLYAENNMSDDYYIDCLRLLDSYISIYKELFFACTELRVEFEDTSVYETLVKEFIEDKDVFVTPAGLNLYLKADTCDNDNAQKVYSNKFDKDFDEFIVKSLKFGREELKIPLGKLSSGENKILALAYFTLNSDASVLIMDEPELSTSIVWQEMMLPTILEYGNFKSIVIATHSPYIVRDESLKDYIEYLP